MKTNVKNKIFFFQVLLWIYLTLLPWEQNLSLKFLGDRWIYNLQRDEQGRKRPAERRQSAGSFQSVKEDEELKGSFEDWGHGMSLSMLLSSVPSLFFTEMRFLCELRPNHHMGSAHLWHDSVWNMAGTSNSGYLINFYAFISKKSQESFRKFVFGKVSCGMA